MFKNFKVIFLVLAGFCLAEWDTEVEKVAEFIIKYNGTKWEVVRAIEEMLNNQNWTLAANFLIFAFTSS